MTVRPAPARVALVFGTRPEGIKMAPIVRELETTPGLRPIVVVTGQHRGILDQVLEAFGIVPDADLDLMRPGHTPASITAQILTTLTPVLDEVKPDLVVVQGDTTTTLAAALASFYARIPVAHVEAGLRTGDRWSPYPEEINRKLTTQIASLHFAPTPVALSNLLAEGVARDDVVLTGNSVIDALHWIIERRPAYGLAELEQLDTDPRRVLLVTTHRRESWGEPMRRTAEAVATLARTRRDLLVVLPMHPNPAVRDTLVPVLGGYDNVLLTEPIPYASFARLLQRADLVLTDSGGVQEEAPSLGKPVLVARESTERPEAVAAGTARLVGTSHDRIVSAVVDLLDDPAAYGRMACAVNPYGDGLASRRIVAAIAHLLGRSAEPIDELRPADDGLIGAGTR